MWYSHFNCYGNCWKKRLFYSISNSHLCCFFRKKWLILQHLKFLPSSKRERMSIQFNLERSFTSIVMSDVLTLIQSIKKVLIGSLTSCHMTALRHKIHCIKNFSLIHLQNVFNAWSFRTVLKHISQPISAVEIYIYKYKTVPDKIPQPETWGNQDCKTNSSLGALPSILKLIIRCFLFPLL